MSQVYRWQEETNEQENLIETKLGTKCRIIRRVSIKEYEFGYEHIVLVLKLSSSFFPFAPFQWIRRSEIPTNNWENITTSVQTKSLLVSFVSNNSNLFQCARRVRWLFDDWLSKTHNWITKKLNKHDLELLGNLRNVKQSFCFDF